MMDGSAGVVGGRQAPRQGTLRFSRALMISMRREDLMNCKVRPWQGLHPRTPAYDCPGHEGTVGPKRRSAISHQSQFCGAAGPPAPACRSPPFSACSARALARGVQAKAVVMSGQRETLPLHRDPAPKKGYSFLICLSRRACIPKYFETPTASHWSMVWESKETRSLE